MGLSRNRHWIQQLNDHAVRDIQEMKDGKNNPLFFPAGNRIKQGMAGYHPLFFLFCCFPPAQGIFKPSVHLIRSPLKAMKITITPRQILAI